MSADRWERIRVTLAEAGVESRIDSRRYPGDVSRSIAIPLRDRGWDVEIHDRWWRKNDNVWIGWSVYVVDNDSIERRSWPLTKKRSEVRDAVLSALAQYGARETTPERNTS